MQVIAIDVGRSGVKVVSDDKEKYFPSKVGGARDMDIGENGDYVVTVNGQDFFVGDMSMESYTQREMATKTKMHDESKILFATGIATVVNDPVVYVTTGLPIDLHGQQKVAMADFLQGQYHVSLNGKEKSFLVKEVGIVPEGAGIYWRLQNFNKKNNNIRIINLGSRTINALTVKNGRFWDKESACLDWGMFEMDVAGDTLGVKEQFARKIKGDISKTWLTYQADSDIVVIGGGGALRLGEQLKGQFLVTHITENPVMDDVGGMYEMGVAKCLGK